MNKLAKITLATLLGASAISGCTSRHDDSPIESERLRQEERQTERSYHIGTAPMSPKTGLGIAAADYDGNGMMDVALGANLPEGWNTEMGLYVFFQESQGAFSRKYVGKVPMSPNTGTGITAADMNNDGTTDIIVGANLPEGWNTNMRLYVFYNDGKGNFRDTP